MPLSFLTESPLPRRSLRLAAPHTAPRRWSLTSARDFRTCNLWPSRRMKWLAQSLSSTFSRVAETTMSRRQLPSIGSAPRSSHQDPKRWLLRSWRPRPLPASPPRRPWPTKPLQPAHSQPYLLAARNLRQALPSSFNPKTKRPRLRLLRATYRSSLAKQSAAPHPRKSQFPPLEAQLSKIGKPAFMVPPQDSRPARSVLRHTLPVCKRAVPRQSASGRRKRRSFPKMAKRRSRPHPRPMRKPR